jgi:glycine/D-amino acid oxidase-like deaminating enzyme
MRKSSQNGTESSGLGSKTPRSEECDVLVIGSGAAGLSTAVRAAFGGLTVIVVEKDAFIGGTSAVSGGWLWLPGNPRGAALVGDTREEIELYLRSIAGECYDPEAVSAFLDAIGPMLEFFEQETKIEFIYPEVAPDYEMRLPGAKSAGRAMYAAPINGREIGADRMRLRPYLRELTVLGVMPQIGPDLEQFLHANQSLRSFWYVTKRILRNWAERVVFRRGLDLSNGNALIARLVLSAQNLGVPIWTSAVAERLCSTDGAVTGAVVHIDGGPVRIRSRLGVVLACGGFTQSVELRAALMDHTPDGTDHFSPVSRNHTGEALRLAAPLGAHLNDRVLEPAAWAPVSVFRSLTGKQRVFPHLRGVGLPGIIAVDSRGRRFANEADSYHRFVAALIADSRGEADVHAFLICDSRTLHKYGLGFAKPWPLPKFPYRFDGYLIRGRSLASLAARAGIDPKALEATVELFNVGARSGEDREFGRGEDEFNRFKGDPLHRPNPSLAPIERPPFYATRIHTGDLGSYVGLTTNSEGAVLTETGAVIPGLHAVGTAAATIFGGTYPGPGANLGPAMTLGFLVGRHLAAEGGATRENESSSREALRHD